MISSFSKWSIFATGFFHLKLFHVVVGGGEENKQIVKQCQWGEIFAKIVLGCRRNTDMILMISFVLFCHFSDFLRVLEKMKMLQNFAAGFLVRPIWMCVCTFDNEQVLTGHFLIC